MCGILGIVNPTGRANLPDRLPLELLRHRGPDQQGEWHGDDRCLLGHTRLSILDLDPRAGQPMHSEDGRYTVTFNGEIYNYLELRQEHLADFRHRTESDTETLLHMWQRYGVSCLSYLRGMFAFAVWDSLTGELWFARDRLGKKPLHYALVEGGGIAFSSELDALVSTLPGKMTLSADALDLFLGYRFIPAPLTIYEGVFKAQPAHVYHYRVADGSLSSERYWHLKFEGFERKLDEPRVLDELDALVQQNVSLRLRSDVPLGMLLSGGVDSSLVTAIGCGTLGDGVPTFSVGYDNGDGELPYAAMVAEKYRTEHHPLILTQHEAMGRFEAMVAAYGEPYGDNSALPSLFVCEHAAQRVKVVLNGDGGDEILAGYGAYNLRPSRRILASLGPELHHAALAIEQAMQGLPLPPAYQRAVEKVASAISPCTKILRLGQFISTGYRRFLYHPAFYQNASGSRARHERALLSLPGMPRDGLNMLLDLDYNHFLAHDLLVKMDIASMRSSLEARSPLLDHTLFEFCAGLPASFKIRNGEGKYLLKKLAERYVPAEAIYRKKMGFSIPVDAWMRGEFGERLSAMARDAEHPLWAVLNRSSVMTLHGEHQARRKSHTFRLWLALVLGSWLESHPDVKPKWA